MKVVLTQDVKGLGTAGELRDVADGHARNFLLPRGLAIPATPGALQNVEAQRHTEERRAAKQEGEAQRLAEQIASGPLRLRAKAGEKHRLYGAVTAADIAVAISKRLQQPFDKRKIDLEEPIRALGTYTVPVNVAKGVVASVTVEIEPDTGG